MKVSLSLLILFSNIIYGSTSREYLNEGQPGLEQSANQADQENLEVDNLDAQPVTLAKEWPEQVFASDSEEKPQKEQLQPENPAPEEPERDHLIGHDYFRIDSGDSDKAGPHTPLFEEVGNQLDPQELKQFKAEIAAGDVTQLFGTNPHFFQPDKYREFGRRFVLQYPYAEVLGDKLSQDGEDIEVEDNSLIPKLAPPALVLQVAKDSAMLAAATPINPTDDLIKKDILRTGEYWNAFWKEDIDPKTLLRSKKRNKMVREDTGDHHGQYQVTIDCI